MLGFDGVPDDWECLVFFFFQAEDGIRDYKVTGVQTCALPISHAGAARSGQRHDRRAGGPCERGRRPAALGMTGGQRVTVETAAGMRALGKRLASLLRAGDLVILSGSLGAGKTTLVQGIGEGLGVRGPVTSPTFVIARIHPSLTGGPDLVHADAYRLTSPAEVDDLDLDEAMDSSVT